MIRRLRRKIILINLLLVGLVLTVGLSLLIAANVRRLETQTRSALRMVLTLQEGEDSPRFEIGAPPPEGRDWDHDRNVSLIPVYWVTVEDGAVTSVNDSGLVNVSEETAVQAVQEALATGQEQGVLSSLGLRFLMEPTPDGLLRIAFADRTWEISSIRTLILSCLLIWVLAMAAFLWVGRLLATLALRPAEKAWKQQRQFVADASHELKTPLTVILANTGIVLAHPQDRVADQAKWLDYTQQEARQMKGLVEDLLFLAKSDDARLPFQPMPVDLSQLVQGCLLPFEPVAFEAGVSLESSIPPDLTLTGDEAQLRRLVRILLDNAVKYAGGSAPAVTVALARQQDKLRLTVHNTGEPIPPEHLPHLFERFYRADAARDRSQGGYGLGLAIARSITQAHRGKIGVSSTAAGTTFTVLLPRR